MQEEDVNVGVRKQRASAKTSERDQGEVRGISGRANQFSPKPVQDLFDQSRPLCNRLGPISIHNKFLLDASGFVGVKLP